MFMGVQNGYLGESGSIMMEKIYYHLVLFTVIFHLIDILGINLSLLIKVFLFCLELHVIGILSKVITFLSLKISSSLRRKVGPLEGIM